MSFKSTTCNDHEELSMNASEVDLQTQLITMKRKLTSHKFRTLRSAKKDVLKYLTRIRECPTTHPEITRLVLTRAFELHAIGGDSSFGAEVEYNVGLTNQFDDEPKNLHFFLKGANDSKLTLNGIRLQDYLLAVLGRNNYRKLNWENLYTLIKFGTKDLASPYSYKSDSRTTLIYQDFKGIIVPPYPLLELLSSLMKEVYRFSRVQYDPVAYKKEDERCGTVLQCMKMVFRAIKMFPRCHLPKCNGPYFTDFGFLENKMAESYATMICLQNELGHFPEVEERASVKVTPLIHLCRMSIRGRLYNNWKLPAGIYQLPLPAKTKKFIDLRTSAI